MDLKTLTAAVTDACLLVGHSEILASLMEDSSHENIELQACTLPIGSPLQMGLLHYGDIIRTYHLREMLGHGIGEYEAENVFMFFRRIDGFEELNKKPVGEFKVAEPAKLPDNFPAREPGEDIVTWLWRCPIWSWANFSFERDVVNYQGRNPIMWADKKPITMPLYRGSTLTHEFRRIISSGDPKWGPPYVKIMPKVLDGALTSGLMVIDHTMSIGDNFNTYVLAEKYKLKK